MPNSELPVDLYTREHTRLFKEALIFRKKGFVRARRLDKPERITTTLADGTRETDRWPVPAGHWVVTNPGGEEYAMDKKKFRRLYSPTGVPGLYKPKGMIRAFPNPTGKPVVINAPWGEPQVGNEYCIFAITLRHNGKMGKDRYIVGLKEFLETYEMLPLTAQAIQPSRLKLCSPFRRKKPLPPDPPPSQPPTRSMFR